MLRIHWAHFRNRKSTKCNFLPVFLKNRYLNKNFEFSPFFSSTRRSIRLKLFYKYLNRIGMHDFFLENLVRAKFGRCYKITTIEKIRFLIVSSVFRFSRTTGIGNNIYQTKKNTHPDWFLVGRQKSQPWKIKYEYLRGEGAQIIFSPCDSHISLKGASGNLEAITTFAPLIKIYLPRKFLKFSLSRSRETPERWGWWFS
jgi:hypothetical protein